MKHFIFYILLIITGLLASCKKIELEPVDGDPVFTAEFKIDGNKHIWEAGNEGYYMFSNFQKDPFDIFVFSGKLAEEDSSVCCVNTLEFLIRDARQIDNNTTEINAALSTDIDYSFVDFSENNTTITIQIDTIWLATFNAISYVQPPQPIKYRWEFRDTQVDSAFIDSIKHNYELPPDNQTVTLITSALNGSCSSYFSRKISASNNPVSNCNLNVSLEEVSNNTVLISTSATGIAPFVYIWSDGSTSSSFQTDSTGINIGPFQVSVTVTDALGCSVTAGIATNITPGAVPQVCVSGFDYNIEQTVVDSQIVVINPTDSLQFSAVTIIYKDDTGVEFRSDRQTQLPSASFKITSVEDYDLNEKGQKTKKISLIYSCRVWDEQGNFVDLTDGKATIAVAYP